MQKQQIQKKANTNPTASSVIPTRPFAPQKPASSEAQSHNLLAKPLFPIQAKLTIGQPNDKYEQEADRVAHQIVNQIQTQPIQRQEIAEDEELRMKSIAQRQSEASSMTADPEVENAIRRSRGSGQPLTASIREPMEQAFGSDFSGVRIHTSPQADQLNQSLQAKAFTTQRDIFFRQGAYSPQSSSGQELLAHELTHVVQQTGTIQATPQIQCLFTDYDSLNSTEKYYVDKVLPFGKNTKDAKSAVKQLYKNDTRLFTSPERAALAQLAQSSNGRTWLKDSGFTNGDIHAYAVVLGSNFPMPVADYAEGTDFGGWENLPSGFRLWTASYAGVNRAQQNVQNKPPMWKVDAIESKDPATANAAKQRIYARDAQVWQDTLTDPTQAQKNRLTDPGGANLTANESTEVQTRTTLATEIVRRLFVVMQYGLNYYDTQGALNNWTEQVAVALSHGGRVNIRIPAAKKDPNRFFKWLIGEEAETSGVHTRTAGTHRVAIGEGQTGSFKEKKGFGAAINAKVGTETGETHHYGLDLPVGGLGNVDINGAVILPNGSYGHLYIGYKPPTATRDGALLIGCETDAPGSTNALGHKHDWRAKSAEFSTTGGAKSGKIGREKTGMMIDLAAIQNAPGATTQTPAQADWMQKLKKLEAEVVTGRVTTQELVGDQANFRQNPHVQAIIGLGAPATDLRT
ncbi:DUF4157 domain-containing protein [Phormidesmis sp. 146-12]